MSDERARFRKRIDRYREFVAVGLNPLTTQRIHDLIADLERQMMLIDDPQKAGSDRPRLSKSDLN